MCKSEIFAKIINIVSKETEVPVDRILSSDKNMETGTSKCIMRYTPVGRIGSLRTYTV